ncbi:hypothetical protein GCM10027578_22180 [Spirosoma luteolum]
MWFLIPLALSAVASGAAIWNQTDQNSQLRAAAAEALKQADATNVASKQAADVDYVAAVDAANRDADRLRQQAAQSVETSRRILTSVFLMLALVSIGLTIRLARPR